MRPFEILLVILTIGTTVSLFVERWTRWRRLLAAGCVVAALLHAIWEGAHWQMIPAYIAAAVAIVAAVTSLRERRIWRIASSACSVLLVAVSALVSYALPMFRLPRPTGPYPVGTSILYLRDTSRVDDASPGGRLPRELMVQVWYPAEPSHNQYARYRERPETNTFSSYQSVLATNSRLNAPVAQKGPAFPMLLFNHSWSGRRTNYTYLTEDLASHGYVVVSIDHTYNASVVAFPDGRVVRKNSPVELDNVDASTPEQVRAVWNKELMKSTADERFVLDQMEAMNRTPHSLWYGRLNTNLAGAIGHSFGGAAATEICAEDARVRSSVNMDGWFFHAITARGPNQPLLVISEYFDQTAVENTKPDAATGEVLDKTDWDDTKRSLEKLGGYWVTIYGTAHNDFSDQPLISPLNSISHRGSVPPRELEKVVRDYVLAFFDKTLRGTDSGILQSKSHPFPEASLQVWSDGRNNVASSGNGLPGNARSQGFR